MLPGAWSGYRLEALQTNETFNPDILQKKYFKTIINPQLEEGEDAYKQANMYLAEDRILSLAIYCQPNKNYYLKYIPNARAKTDPMKSHFNVRYLLPSANHTTPPLDQQLPIRLLIRLRQLLLRHARQPPQPMGLHHDEPRHAHRRHKLRQRLPHSLLLPVHPVQHCEE